MKMAMQGIRMVWYKPYYFIYIYIHIISGKTNMLMSPYRDLLSSLLSSLSPRALVAGQGSLQHHLDSKISKQLVDGASRHGDIMWHLASSRFLQKCHTNSVPRRNCCMMLHAVVAFELIPTWWRWWSPSGPLSSRHKDCQHARPLPQRLDHRSVYVSPRRVVLSIKCGMFSPYASRHRNQKLQILQVLLGGPHLPRLSIDYRTVWVPGIAGDVPTPPGSPWDGWSVPNPTAGRHDITNKHLHFTRKLLIKMRHVNQEMQEEWGYWPSQWENEHWNWAHSLVANVGKAESNNAQAVVTSCKERRQLTAPALSPNCRKTVASLGRGCAQREIVLGSRCSWFNLEKMCPIM